jgi:hypothetical protein
LTACDAPSRLASPSSSAAFSSSSNSSGSSSKESEDNSGDGGDDGSAGGSVGRRIFEVRTARTQVNNAGAGTGIYFHGGRVLTNASVAAVYWAPTQPVYAGGPAVGVGTGDQDRSLIGHFLRNLGASPYYNINSTYTNASGAKIPNTLSYAGYWATSAGAPAPGQSVTDAQILALLQTGFNTPNGLAYDPNRIYAVFTAGTANLGGGFGTQYCAYHWYGNVTINGVRKSVLYAAMPYDYAYPSACSVFGGATKPANGDAPADAEVSVLAHEIVETVTDAQGTAWYDRSGNENADKCAWTYGATFSAGGGTANMTLGGLSFLVQRNWINAGSGGCVLSY